MHRSINSILVPAGLFLLAIGLRTASAADKDEPGNSTRTDLHHARADSGERRSLAVPAARRARGRRAFAGLGACPGAKSASHHRGDARSRSHAPHEEPTRPSAHAASCAGSPPSKSLRL